MACDNDTRRRTGAAGEELAARYLQECGHTILDRNWRAGHLEIDIVTVAGDGIHFVEVKSRTYPAETVPQASVNLRKQRRIAAAARRWLAEKGEREMECRFDIVSVVFRDGTYDIDYLPEAYLPIMI